MLKVLGYICLIIILILSIIFLVSILTEWIYAVLNRRKETKNNDYETLRRMDIVIFISYLP